VDSVDQGAEQGQYWAMTPNSVGIALNLHGFEPYPGWIWWRALARDSKHHPTMCKTTNSVRAASCQRTGQSVGGCGLGGSSKVNSGMAVRATSWRWRCLMHMTPLLRYPSMVACGKMTSMKVMNLAMKCLARKCTI